MTRSFASIPPVRNSGLPRLALLVAMLAAPLGSAVFAQELRVLASGADGITIEYRPVVRLRSFSDAGVAYVRPEFAEAASVAPLSPGIPDLQFRGVLLALPGLEGHSVTVLAADYEDTHNTVLAPVPRRFRGDDGLVTSYTRGAEYTRRGLLPESVAELADAGIARDRFLATLRVYPYAFDAAAGQLRLYTRLVVRVQFGPADPRLTSAGRAGESFGGTVVNEQSARGWRIAAQAPLRKTQTASLASGDWYRIEIPQDGVYRLTKAWFTSAGIPISSVDPRSIRIFGQGGRELPLRLSSPRPDDLQEIAIEVSGESDGRFDDNDAVTFYGRGNSGFVWDTVAGRYTHTIHRFDAANAYLLTFGGAAGRRVEAQPSLNEANPYTPQWFTGREFHEEEAVNLISSGKMWVGKRIPPSSGINTQVVMKKLEGLVRDQPVTYRVKLYAQSEVAHSFLLSDGQTLGSIPMTTVAFSTDQDDIASGSGVLTFSRPGDLPEDRSSLKIEYNVSDPDRSRGAFVDWIEWYYARRFTASGDVLDFGAPDTSTVCGFEIQGFSNSDVAVYDVSIPWRVRRIADPAVSGGTVRFQASSRRGAPPQYYAVAANAVRQPAAPTRLSNSDLAVTQGAQYVIITSQDLAPAAERLKRHRERPGEDAITSKVVTLPEIYNEFSSSVKDPVAIRNFLSYALRSWTVKPKYVLFFGDGHYDYRNYGTDEKIVVPVWESENSINLMASYVTDDYYAQISGDDALVDIATGRLPVLDTAEAMSIVDKIIRYESDPDFAPWKNRVTFVADDGLTTRIDDGPTHTAQSEDIARSLPTGIEQEKVYIVSYRTEITAEGRRKPDANQAIIDRINEGTVVINYTGHGSEAVWAHEHVFVTDVTVPMLANVTRPTFLAAATCTFGLYDRPKLRSGTEAMVTKPEGGAIGGLSSPRVVYSGPNSNFNQSFFDNLFANGRETDGRAKRLGDAIFSTKQRWYNDAGYEKFHLFADPGLRLAFPRYRCSIDSILVNGQAAGSGQVQLKALSRVTLKGSVLRPDSTRWPDYNGVATVSLYDAKRSIPVPLEGWGGFSYGVQGGLLFRGEATVADGGFTVTFPIPKDISYENNSGRLAVYFDNDAVDGAGFATNFTVGGSDTSAVTDRVGPEIRLFMDQRSFLPGDVVNESPLLIADLRDESGINTTGLGIGHNIEAWLDGSEASLVLNAFYTGDRDSYQQGTVQYQYRRLAEGTHTLRLRAWDIHNNSSIAETHFSVANSAGLSVQDAYPYPNPMQNTTTFTFTHNQSAAVKVEIKIYTVAGRLIRSIDAGETAERFVRVPWDGRDEEGDTPANGTYFYKIVCRTADGRLGSERIGTLAILR